MSHTVTAKSNYFKNPKALEAAVKAMGGTWLGQANHRLYGSHETGLGFRLPGWSQILCAKADGTLAYDDYHGNWGNVSDLDKLGKGFAIEAALGAAEANGWAYDRTNEGLTIYHPDGGSLLVTGDGKVDAVNFTGEGCQSATEMISSAIGSTLESVNKPEYYHERNKIQELG